MDSSTIYNLVQHEFEYDHPDTRLTRRVASNGAVHFRIQCQTCGATISTPKKADLALSAMNSAPPYSAEIADRWRKRKNERYVTLLAEARAAEKEEFDAWYRDYLLSPRWRNLRTQVFQRARFVCEGCGKNRAAEVHHLTYEHVGEEFLFELVALCAGCHRRLHPDKQPVQSLSNGTRLATPPPILRSSAL